MYGNNFIGFGYVGADSWIESTTIRDNILFGSKYDEVLYKKVLYACALDHDLEILPKGDQSTVGEHGLGLSGGMIQVKLNYHMIG